MILPAYEFGPGPPGHHDHRRERGICSQYLIENGKPVEDLINASSKGPHVLWTD